VVTKWLLEVPNVPPATLEIKPRVNQKSPVSRPAFGFIISGAPHFRNPYLTKVTNHLGSTLLVTSWPTKSELRCAYYGRNKTRIFNGAIMEQLIPLTSKNLPLTNSIC
jgi:hypothetical protein